eukprot:TRINITY_DN13183_c0_g6_i1.p1 TRINITY_DN13183_c0_g6~~TRINITY_DN13183_c0_g6_i1.p1  ORF type:complete len:559 (-),score=108.52 TRINITY_DN13183_c0_g6_i1:304-1980(-)
MGRRNFAELIARISSNKYPTEAPADLETAQKRAIDRMGLLPVAGRYFRLPRRIQDDYQMDGKVLGKGMSGSVVSATCKHSPQQKYAVKSFNLKGLQQGEFEHLSSEVEIFLSMDHPRVARLMAVYESEDQLSLVMEAMEGGELYSRIQKRKVFSEEDAADAAKQMLEAVSYIHHEGVVHRDLKLENFLYDAPESRFLKLIDFGFSKFFSRRKMDEALGTLPYAAPEVLEKNYTCGSCDLWSLGVIVFILIAGHMPFAGRSDKETALEIRSGNYSMRKSRWAHISEEGQDFVKSLLVVNPRYRLTAQAALEHPWILRHTGASAGFELPMRSGSVRKGFDSYARAPDFKKACLQVMAWALPLDERRKLREIFLALTAAHGGVVTRGELEKALRHQVACQESSSCLFPALEAMNAMDKSRDDVIHYSDFLAAMMAKSELDQHDDVVRATFRNFDLEGNGYLAEADLKSVLGDRAETSSIFKEVDSDNDGRISYDDFISYLKKVGPDPRQPRILRRESSQESSDSTASAGFRDKLRAFFGLPPKSRPRYCSTSFVKRLRSSY